MITSKQRSYQLVSLSNHVPCGSCRRVEHAIRNSAIRSPSAETNVVGSLPTLPLRKILSVMRTSVRRPRNGPILVGPFRALRRYRPASGGGVGWPKAQCSRNSGHSEPGSRLAWSALFATPRVGNTPRYLPSRSSLNV